MSSDMHKIFEYRLRPTAKQATTLAVHLEECRMLYNHFVEDRIQANETSNLHSLAVQMRPVLECAGQVVFIFHNTIIAPDLLVSREKAIATYGNRLNADFYQTFSRVTRGQISREKLREMATQAQAAAAASVGAAKPKRQKSWRLYQADKVANLAKGDEWYDYLSDHFTHGKSADWKGLSWRGGVMSIDQG